MSSEQNNKQPETGRFSLRERWQQKMARQKDSDRFDNIVRFLQYEQERNSLPLRPEDVRTLRNQDAARYLHELVDIDGLHFPDGHTIYRPGVDPRDERNRVWTLGELESEAMGLAQRLNKEWQLPLT